MRIPPSVGHMQGPRARNVEIGIGELQPPDQVVQSVTPAHQGRAFWGSDCGVLLVIQFTTIIDSQFHIGFDDISLQLVLFCHKRSDCAWELQMQQSKLVNDGSFGLISHRVK